MTGLFAFSLTLQAQQVKFEGYNKNGALVVKNVGEVEKTNTGGSGNKGPLPIAQMPKTIFTLTKTMNATAFGDTVLTFYPGGAYKSIRFVVQDSSGNSKTDSFKVYVKDTTALHAGVQWIQVPCKNITLAAQTAALDVVPGDGAKAVYECMFEYAATYKIVRINSSYKARTKSFVSAYAIRP
jgi:hypothetical protein